MKYVHIHISLWENMMTKKLLIILGDPGEMEIMIKNNKRTLRYTMLDDFLKRDEESLGL